MNALSNTIETMGREIRERGLASNRQFIRHSADTYIRYSHLRGAIALIEGASFFKSPTQELVERDDAGEGSSLTEDIIRFYWKCLRENPNRTPMGRMAQRGAVWAEIRILRAQRAAEAEQFLAAAE